MLSAWDVTPLTKCRCWGHGQGLGSAEKIPNLSREHPADSSQWLLNWAIAYSTPYLVNWGPGYANLQSKIFFIWFGCCFICIAFVYFCIYETKGLTLEEVDEMYNDPSVNPRNSKHWRPKVTFKQRASVAHQGGVVGEKDSDSGAAAAHHEDHVDHVPGTTTTTTV
jgi:MFS transporter, SP family, sugar:H+ symporter